VSRPLELSDAEVRVLACLVEKQRTTPDGYPLTLNSLRLACNQATNRDPVLDLDEVTVREAAQRLGRRGLTRFTSSQGSRAAKYRHVMGEALDLAPDETAVLCLLMLRGAQTAGELKGRSERLHAFASPAEAEETLERLAERELVKKLERRPGEKGNRWEHLLGTDAEEASAVSSQPSALSPQLPDSLEQRVAALEARLEELERQLGA
jgi:uncharacterized protein YceH (UPF0502 family)